MQLYQHVYGRVAEGLHGAYPGYQLAARSNELAEYADALEMLQRLSFFNLRGGSGTEVRYSFYRPAKGFLAFGRSRLAQDKSGAVGAFAHHFICEEEPFINSRISPVDLLKRLKFYNSENDLPSNRSLEVIDCSENEAAPPTSRFRMLALQLVEMYLDRSEPDIPMVVASDEEAWEILNEVFALLPRLEASRLSFSTLFVDAMDFAENFRLVFVPERKYVPAAAYAFRVFDSGVDGAEANQTKPCPLTTLWRTCPQQAPAVLRLVYILRHTPERLDEAAALLPGLFKLGKIFRDCVESLQIPRLFDLILRDAHWIIMYRRAGGPLQLEPMRAPLWREPNTYLIPLMTAAPQLEQSGFADHVLRELAERAASGEVGIELISALPSPEALNRFYEVAKNKLNVELQQQLASRLRGETFYALQLHHTIAHRVVQLIADGNKQDWDAPFRWLERESDVFSHRSYDWAAVELARWTAQESERNFTLNSFHLTAQQYKDLLEAMWTAGTPRLDADRLDGCLFHQDYRAEYWAFLIRRLRISSFGTQKGILRIIAARFGAAATDDREFLDALKRAEDSSDLARYFMELLDRKKALDRRAQEHLRSLIKRRWW